MKWNIKSLIDRASVSMPVFMILVAGSFAKVGYPNWGLTWIALCAPLIMAELIESRGRSQAAV
jgi:hypothetical protein